MQTDPDTEPQQILSSITQSAIFLTLTIDPGAEDAVREALANVSGLKRSVGFRIPEAGLTCVTGIGAAAWERLHIRPRPAALHPFRELNGPKHRAPATPGDLLFHIRAQRMDLCFELAQLLVDQLRPHVHVVDEVHGFRSFDERDMLGFVDGTENPEGAAAWASVVIGEEDPGFTGGSYVIVQKYLHDLESWNALSIEDQERVIGRTKLDDVEFADEVKAPDSHLVLNTIVDEQGDERQIVRFNMPFGRVGAGEFGTFFIGYARDPEVIEQMLENMFLGTASATHDRILDFSTAATGTLFFVPSLAMLDALADEPAASAQAPPADHDADGSHGNDGDGTLGIGSLKGASS